MIPNEGEGGSGSAPCGGASALLAATGSAHRQAHQLEGSKPGTGTGVIVGAHPVVVIKDRTARQDGRQVD
jgi:hypothetical protein